MVDLREPAARRRAADLLGRGIGRDQRGKRRLERDQAPEQLVVLGVLELGRVLLVVQAVRPADLLGELGVAGLGRLGIERRRLLDECGVDGERLGHGALGHASPNWSTAIEAMWSPIASDAVAAGDGALRTWMTEGAESNTKSSTRSPARERA